MLKVTDAERSRVVEISKDLTTCAGVFKDMIKVATPLDESSVEPVLLISFNLHC